MTNSQNGWLGIEKSTDPLLTDFPWVTGKVRKGDVYTVLNYVADQFNTRVEKIDKAKSWGWNYRAIRGATKLSNHASGTAVDFNAPDHWLGRVGTFSAAQTKEIRKILTEVNGVVRWGGDYAGRKDEMHFEINLQPKGSAANVKAVADKITYMPTIPTVTIPAFPLPKGWYFGPEKPLWRIKSVSGKYRYGSDLKRWQTQAKAKGYKVDVTGVYDAKTNTAAQAMQIFAGITKDGLIGATTWPLAWSL